MGSELTNDTVWVAWVFMFGYYAVHFFISIFWILAAGCGLSLLIKQLKTRD